MHRKRKKQRCLYSALLAFLLLFTSIGSVFAAENPAPEESFLEEEVFQSEPEEPVEEEPLFEEEPIEGDTSGEEEPFLEEEPSGDAPLFEELPPAEEEPPVAPEEEESTEDLSDGSAELFADGGNGAHIKYENGFHYIWDETYQRNILLYCMNCDRLWPNHISGGTVPGYEEGYLTEESFGGDKQKYQDCMRRLAKLLYAGYPYNGERLYKIVDTSGEYVPTETEFNEMLQPLPILQTAFPYLGHHDFKYADWNADPNKRNQEHMDLLTRFVKEVLAFSEDYTTENGLYKADIFAMPFYQSAYSMFMADNYDNKTPIDVYVEFYSTSFYVTEKEAYDATQNAIWALMHHYGIEDNKEYDESLLNLNKLAKSLFTYSERGGLLNREPQEKEITIDGDFTFKYNPKDGYFHSGEIIIHEPTIFHGLYNLKLPKGVNALCDNLTYVYGEEPYELVSETMPPEGAQFSIDADFVWMKEFKQYHPAEELTGSNGKKYQNMVGAVINTKSISKSASFKRGQEGSLKITKKSVVEQNKDPNKEFTFFVRLPNNTDINGIYGDLNFHEGISEEFTIKECESKIALHLPAGTKYEVIESDSGSYVITGTGTTGTIQDNVTAEAKFTNIRRPQLTLSKEVTGEAGNKKETFTFEITLNDEMNKPVNGTFQYQGGVKPGFENQGVTAPKNGWLEFKNGKATVSLSHGQQITVLDLPDKSAYTIQETGADTYITTYNDKQGPAAGTLDSGENTHVTETVHVVNNKEFAPDTGLKDANGKGIAAALAVALSGALLLAGEILLKKRIKK